MNIYNFYHCLPLNIIKMKIFFKKNAFGMPFLKQIIMNMLSTAVVISAVNKLLNYLKIITGLPLDSLNYTVCFPRRYNICAFI